MRAEQPPPGIRVEAARRIAEAEVDVIRVRRARRELLSQTLSAPRGRPIGPRRLRQRLELLDRAVRITTKGRMLPTELSDALIRMEAEEERSKMLPFFGPEFAIIDRYERRARRGENSQSAHSMKPAPR